MKFKVNPELDPSKIDINNDFGSYPKLFISPEDIEIFIKERNVDVPALSYFLDLRNKNKLDLTPTESKFIFDEFFDYCYDVFTIPIEETFLSVEKWLGYLNDFLIEGGLSRMTEQAYERASDRFNTIIRINNSLKGIKFKRKEPAIINYYEVLGDLEYAESSIYNRKIKSTKEQFWIKSCNWAGQPFCIGDEAYMGVWVFEDRVRIFGCDDCSYTLEGNEKELTEFVLKLKTAAPVWNFNYLKHIHPKLEFTN